ncbi:hypothetical protein GCK72_005287 [Caenorhabditis remanei]|uniref:Uncharacterized protein n=1 Tax=Caenorhabditis remanei TaxID=31234 RepID=A0A6A5HDE8_CAERE|nr:hypothetical protein GCK72_005287 [Caenorhabditis remanei]KAF1765335.1 hypothetical protein GCK72_005287 [Caenorhabditis remanei]
MPRIKLLLLLIIFHFAIAEKIPLNSESCAPGNFVHERKALYYSWSRMVVGYVDTWKSKECVSGNSNPLSCGITYFYVAIINFEDDKGNNRIDASKLTVKCSDNMIYSAMELPKGVEPNILYKSYLNCQGDITVDYVPPHMVYLKFILIKAMFLSQDIFLYLLICVIFVEMFNRIM